MSKVLVQDSQTIFDIAMQQYGNVEAVFDLTLHNDLDWDVEPEKGTTLNLLTDFELSNITLEPNPDRTIEQDEYNYQVKENQSLYDIALQEQGSVEAVFDLLIDNQQAFEEAFGTELKIKRSNIKDRKVLQYVGEKRLVFATQKSKAFEIAKGIGEIIIEDTFIVS